MLYAALQRQACRFVFLWHLFVFWQSQKQEKHFAINPFARRICRGGECHGVQACLTSCPSPPQQPVGSIAGKVKNMKNKASLAVGERLHTLFVRSCTWFSFFYSTFALKYQDNYEKKHPSYPRIIAIVPMRQPDQ